ncbi:MAG: GntP family permease [Ferruginibacter sp.]|nr:GntP family permease [Cytophagales bacterium]
MTARVRLNAFFVLLMAAIGVGLAAGLPASEILTTLKKGFGSLIEAIGIVVIAGTVLGVILEKTGATTRMAAYLLAKAGEKNAALAISLTGFLVGLPIFCDSGFVVLSGLNRSLAGRTRTPMAVMAVSLATGLYAVHCLVPPHPGVSAAAGLIGVDPGRLMLVGTLVAVPGAAIGYAWARFRGRDYPQLPPDPTPETEPVAGTNQLSAGRAFLPIAVPIALIALKAVLVPGSQPPVGGYALVGFVGDPIVALLIGIGLALTLVRNWSGPFVNGLLTEGVDKAGPVLAIVAAGGAFGAVLKATGIGDSLGQVLAPLQLGIFLPFIIASVLKTVQGSSTVAIITTASLVGPLFPELRLDSDWGRLLGTLAMGAGSMMVSHANDAFFWVVTRFSDLEPGVTFRVYSTATLLMGLLTQAIVFGLSLVLR